MPLGTHKSHEKISEICTGNAELKVQLRSDGGGGGLAQQKCSRFID